MNEMIQTCTRCIMDSSAVDIQFDELGMCNYCKDYESRVKSEVHTDKAGQRKLSNVVEEIRLNGKNKSYDCLVGVSGGVDSTMAAYIVRKQLGLRALAVHFDNGWNSGLAIANIEQIVKELEIDLYTFVVDWEEFKDLQLSFLRASVSNSEIPTDHGIVACLFRTADDMGVPYIFNGGNVITEGIMPGAWVYEANDLRLIKSIHRRFGKRKLATFPMLSIFDWIYYTYVKQIRFMPVLNYFEYDRQKAKEFLEKEIGWKDYGAKHHESIYTRFFQNYILPRKFGIDKRRAHFSSLICSGQMSRKEALVAMEQEVYPEAQLREDRDFVINKLGISNGQLEEIMHAPVRSYEDYPNNSFLFRYLRLLVNLSKKRAKYI